MNVYFLLTFPLAAAAAYLAFRHLGATRAPSVVCATLFALLPYHFVRGETHLFYSAYFAVPIGAYLALAVFTGEPLFVRRAGRAGHGAARVCLASVADRGRAVRGRRARVGSGLLRALHRAPRRRGHRRRGARGTREGCPGDRRGRDRGDRRRDGGEPRAVAGLRGEARKQHGGRAAELDRERVPGAQAHTARPPDRAPSHRHARRG